MSDLDADPEVEAAKLGLTVVYPADDELFVDIDDWRDLHLADEMIKVLVENGVQCAIDRTVASRQLGHHHVYVKLPGRQLTDIERICLQTCLGSDRKRELLSLLRVWLGVPRPPTCFFEKLGCTCGFGSTGTVPGPHHKEGCPLLRTAGTAAPPTGAGSPLDADYPSPDEGYK